MEYIRITFDPADIRDVIANGSTVGQTETVLMVPTNFYVVKLSGNGYAPPTQGVNVVGTLPDLPMLITFAREVVVADGDKRD